MEVIIRSYNKCKFLNDRVKLKEEIYNINSFDVEKLNNKEASEIGFKEPDFNNEYIVLNLENGNKQIFRCSFIDMFKI